MVRPKKQLNRKTEILDAAQSLFATKGFEKTTIDEIARHIEIGKGTVYLDFKNKNEILQGIIERNMINLIKKNEALVENANPPFLNALEEYIKNDITSVFDMATSHINTHITLIHTSYQLKQDLKHLITRCRKTLASLLEKSANNGETQKFPDYEHLSQLISISLQGFFPPYDLKYPLEHRKDLKKHEIRDLLLNDASVIIKLLLSGLKSVK